MILYNPLRFNVMLLSNCSSKWSLPFPLSNQNSARLSYHSRIVICLRHLIHHNVVILIILTFFWPCILLYLSQYLTNLMHKICFTIRFISCLYMFEYMCSSSGGQNCITQPLVSSHLIVWWYQRLCNTILTSWWRAHVLEHIEAWNKTYCETNFVHKIG
jgi:hypothetical protein